MKALLLLLKQTNINKIMRLLGYYTQIFIFLIFSLSILKCQSPNNPINEQSEWVDASFNLAGEKLKKIKKQNNSIFLSTLQRIYKLENDTWTEYVNIYPDYIADFEFKEDTLFVLTVWNKLLFKSKDSLINKCSLENRSDLPAYDLCFFEEEAYVGGFSQSPQRNGLTKIAGSSSYNYPMKDYNTAYSVHKIIQHKNSVFVGTFYVSAYFVAKLEDTQLVPIGLGENGYSIGECYSMISVGDDLLVGSGGEVLSYKNDNWSTYGKKLPTIVDTELEDKAISLFMNGNSLLVGTIHNGILTYNDNKEEWENYTKKGLPDNFAINEILLDGDVIYILVGKYSFDDTISSYIYRIKTQN